MKFKFIASIFIMLISSTSMASFFLDLGPAKGTKSILSAKETVDLLREEALDFKINASSCLNFSSYYYFQKSVVFGVHYSDKASEIVEIFSNQSGDFVLSKSRGWMYSNVLIKTPSGETIKFQRNEFGFGVSVNKLLCNSMQ